MNSSDITFIRLKNHHLTSPNFKTPYDVISYLGAVQSQDYPMAKWSIAQRMKSATDSTIEDAYNKGEIIRTHIMRPTWHFVAPEDLRWVRELTSPRVKTFMGHYNRKLELTDDLFKKSNSEIVKALKGNNYLTRQELKDVLGKIGIKGDVQRYAHIIMWAELDSLICSGPRRGKQFTYALVDDRIPKSGKINRDEALYKLSLKYFTSHGPAKLKDFSWWSGLTIKEATQGLDSIKSKLTSETVNGKDYYFVNKKMTKATSTQAFLLSIYDEYTISYKDRGDMSDYREIEKMIMMGNALTAVIIIDGRTRGIWKRTIKKDKVEIKISPFKKLNSDEKIALEKAAEKFGEFLGLKPLLSMI